MATINHKVKILNDSKTGYDTYHAETNVEQVYDFSKSKWLNEIIRDIELELSNVTGGIDVTELNERLNLAMEDLESAESFINAIEVELAKKYVKPENGITLADLNQTIKDSIAKADRLPAIEEELAKVRVDLKSYIDSVIAEVNTKTDGHINDKVSHITDEERNNWNKADAKVATRSEIGHVKVGNGLNVNLSGELSIAGQVAKLTLDSGAVLPANGNDLNEMLAGGFYYGYSLKNAPSTAGYVVVLKRNDTYVSQLFFDNNGASSNDMFRRNLIDNVWQNWVKVLDSDDILDELTSTSMSSALSANKGRELKELIDTKADKTVASTTSNGLMSMADKVKLDGMTNVQQYVHPETHPASIIVEDAQKRFVSDIEKETWNNKASTALASITANGLMSSSDKAMLISADGHTSQSSKHNWYGTSATATATTAKVVVCADFVLNAGVQISVKFTNSQTFNTSITLNVNNTGAFPIYQDGTIGAKWVAGEVVQFTYDGSYWQANATLQAGTTSQVGVVQLDNTITSTSTTKGATANSVKKVNDALNTHVNNSDIHVTSTDKSNWNNKANSTIVTTSANGLMSKEDKLKLDDVEVGANNYVHPDTHPASMIAQDSNNRFVTDAEKTGWNNKASTTLATTTTSGLLSSSDKSKLDGISAGATKTIVENILTSTSSSNALSAYQGKLLKDLIDTKAGSAIVTTTSNGLMSSADKIKLDGFENGANNYVHPDSHPASMIAQSSSYRFVTDSEKSTWNAKASTSIATTTTNGLLSSSDKSKLDGISAGATNTTVVNSLTSTSTSSALSAYQGNQLNSLISSLQSQVNSHVGNVTNPHGTNSEDVNYLASAKLITDAPNTYQKGISVFGLSQTDASTWRDAIDSTITGTFYGYVETINSPQGTNGRSHQKIVFLNSSGTMLGIYERGGYSTSTWGSWVKQNVDITSKVFYAVTSGSANTYTITLPEVTSYVAGLAVAVRINTGNTGASTINVNGLGAKTILKSSGSALTSGNLKTSSIYTLRYNGTNFILQGEGGDYGTAVASDVLTGKTIGTDSGIITGTMPSRLGWSASASSIINITIPKGYHDGNGIISKIEPRVYDNTSTKTLTVQYVNNSPQLHFPYTYYNCGFKPMVWTIHMQLAFINYGAIINFSTTWDYGNAYPLTTDFFTGNSGLNNFWYNGATCSVDSLGVSISNLNYSGQQWWGNVTATVRFKAIGV